MCFDSGQLMLTGIALQVLHSFHLKILHLYSEYYIIYIHLSNNIIYIYFFSDYILTKSEKGYIIRSSKRNTKEVQSNEKVRLNL